MASFTPTYTYANLVTLADAMVSGVATSGIDVTAVDVIDGLFWGYPYPWRWSTASLTAVSLTDGTQDYALSNTNVMQVLSGRINRTDVSTVSPKDVMIMEWFEPDTVSKVSFPNFGSVAYFDIADANKIRLPAAISIPSGQTLTFSGEYKKNHVKLAATSATIVFPDHYIHVFIQGLIWYYYKFARDKRQGTLQIVDGRAVYTGALGEFHDALLWCAQQEGYGKGSTRFPDQPLGATQSSYPSIYGAF